MIPTATAYTTSWRVQTPRASFVRISRSAFSNSSIVMCGLWQFLRSVAGEVGGLGVGSGQQLGRANANRLVVGAGLEDDRRKVEQPHVDEHAVVRAAEWRNRAELELGVRADERRLGRDRMVSTG
jgi:hypothetical protein